MIALTTAIWASMSTLVARPIRPKAAAAIQAIVLPRAIRAATLTIPYRGPEDQSSTGTRKSRSSSSMYALEAAAR